jgi:protein-L-isoaspartate(D-aspartate) O-methyltransferase
MPRSFFMPLLLLSVPSYPAQDLTSSQRDTMVRQQIERRGITNPDVLRVLRSIPRDQFVPALLRGMAYEDRALPIGYSATISQPYIVALMTELLQPGRKDRVLEIGTGSGYQAAVLCELAGHVYTIEIVPELARSARDTLQRLGFKNVTVREGNGFAGWPEQAPFGRIILTAAPAEIPQTLISQLARGGRLVAPVGQAEGQELMVVTKDRQGKVQRRSVTSVAFVPMQGGPR